MPKQNLYIGPNVNQPGLTTELIGKDANGQSVQLPVVTEKAITIFLNNQEIVTAMTIGDYLEELAIGFLFNQGMITVDDKIKLFQVTKITVPISASPFKIVSFSFP